MVNKDGYPFGFRNIFIQNVFFMMELKTLLQIIKLLLFTYIEYQVTISLIASFVGIKPYACHIIIDNEKIIAM